MRDGSTKLILATAALVALWIVTYWLWPASTATPAITFDTLSVVKSTARTNLPPASAPVDPAPAEPKPIGAHSIGVEKIAPSKPQPDPIGATLEPAPTPVFPAVIPPEFEQHVVAEGETIWTIAQKRYGDRNLGGVIARANPTVDPKKLRPGMMLLIPKDPANIQGTPAGTTPKNPKRDIVQYIVAPGDTLGGISKQFYGKASLWTRLRDANPGVVGPDGDVREGARLLIPPPPEEKDTN